MTNYILLLSLLLINLNGAWAQTPKATQNMSDHSLYMKALTSGTAALHEAKSQKGYQQAVYQFDKAYAVNPKDYLSQDLRSQALLALKDSTAAYISIQQAIDNYRSHPPARPDLLMGYVYARKALLETFHLKDIGMALTTLQQGLSVLRVEYTRLQKSNVNITAYTHRFNQIQRDLQNFEIDILRHSPAQFTKALTEKEAELLIDSTHYTLLVSYAQLLENVHPGKAKLTYQKATEVEPDNMHAWLNLGLMEYNQGTRLGQQATTELDFHASKALQEKANAHYVSAIPHLEKVLTLSPCDQSTLLTFRHIVTALNDANLLIPADSQKYKTLLAQCE